MKTIRSFTLIELVMAIVMFGLVLLAITIISTSFTKALNRDVWQANLYQNTQYSLEHILRQVRESNYLEVDAVNNILTLTKNTGAVTVKSEYKLDSASGELRYRPDTASVQYQLLQRNLQAFFLEGVQDQGQNRYQAVRIRIEANDPLSQTSKVAILQSLAFCRPSYSSIVRVTDSTRQTLRGYYGTIQEAINAAQATDIIQVSYNNKQPFSENLNLNKTLTLEGSYDGQGWDISNRHLADPDYETILDGKGRQQDNRVCAILPSSGSPITVKISGFTLQNAGTAIYSTVNSTNIIVERCKIQDNGTRSSDAPSAIYLSGGIAGGSKLEIRNCEINDNSNRASTIFINNDLNGSLVIENTSISGNRSGCLINIDGSVNNFLIRGCDISANTLIAEAEASIIKIDRDFGHECYLEDLSIFNTRINTNTINTTNRSGVIWIAGVIEGGGISLNNCEFSHNTIRGDDSVSSGIIFIQGASQASTFSMNNCNISDNKLSVDMLYRSDHESGVIFILGGVGNFAMTNSLIDNNSLGEDSDIHGKSVDYSNGIIYLYQGVDNFSLSNSQITNNIIKGSTGGTIVIDSVTNFTINNSEITGNTAAHYFSPCVFCNGCLGIILLSRAQTFSLANSNIKNNAVHSVGSVTCVGIIYARSSNLITSRYLVANTNIVNNELSPGGFIANDYSMLFFTLDSLADSFSMSNSNLAYNTLTCDGMILELGPELSATKLVRNSILYGNVISCWAGCGYFSGTKQYSCVQNLSHPADGNINAEPLFMAGSPYDYHLQASSPCKNTGDPDIRDPDGSPSDMGAYGGPGAANPIGYYSPVDDPLTPDIREDIIGTYSQLGPQ